MKTCKQYINLYNAGLKRLSALGIICEHTAKRLQVDNRRRWIDLLDIVYEMSNTYSSNRLQIPALQRNFQNNIFQPVMYRQNKLGPKGFSL